jgi:hypothetical protein
MKIRGTAAEYIVDKKDRKKAVLLSLPHYEKLTEDLHDLAAMAERTKEKSVPLAKVMGRLKKNGGL